jgi:hypothetical protein
MYEVSGRLRWPHLDYNQHYVVVVFGIADYWDSTQYVGVDFRLFPNAKYLKCTVYEGFDVLNNNRAAAKRLSQNGYLRIE